MAASDPGTTSLVADLSATASTPFGLYLAAPSDPLADVARALEAEVFLETFGNTRELLDEEYGPFDGVSLFIVVLDHHRARVAGMIRLIFDGTGVLKSMADIEHEPWSVDLDTALRAAGITHLDPARTVDVTTLAVDPEYRGAATNGMVSLALYQGLIRISRAAAMDWLVTILDAVVLDLLQTTVGEPFRSYPGVEPMRYLDSPASVPVWCDLTDYERRLRQSDPGLAETLFDGIGIESAVSPPDYERAAGIVHTMTSAVVDLRDEPIDLTDSPAADRRS